MAKPSFSSEIVRKKVASLFPNISGFEPIFSGEESQAFRFDSEDRKLIFRLNSNVAGFEKERFIYERFARPELPIPKVFLIGQLEDHFYCVSQRMPGKTLQDLDSEQISQLVVPTCDVWRVIGESDIAGITGYGFFDSQGNTTFSTWHEFLFGIVDTVRHQRESFRQYADAIHKWLETFRRLAAFCPEERSLIHGDFGSNNVLAEGGQITGVLDWSEAMIGDPLYDVANIFFWRTWLPCMEQQAVYFEAHPLKVPNWQERLFCYQLRIGLSEILANSMERKDREAIWALGRCEQIVRAIFR